MVQLLKMFCLMMQKKTNFKIYNSFYQSICLQTVTLKASNVVNALSLGRIYHILLLFSVSPGRFVLLCCTIVSLCLVHTVCAGHAKVVNNVNVFNNILAG